MAVENVILSTVGSTVPSAGLGRARWSRSLLLPAARCSRTPLPIDNRYDTPATLGKDRLAAVIGAGALYPGQHCLVVDAGTCMTLDLSKCHWRLSRR